ncbi:MAG: hypothetical protein H8D38_04245 [DPANN group archaeon]|nr:hypothetical protein [DPANN group archaeon]
MVNEEIVRRTIESIKKDFLDFIKRNKLLDDYLSVFIVGSLIGNDYKIEKINDLDLRVIFSKVTYEKAELLHLFLKECEEKYNSEYVDVYSSTVIGIAKPKKTDRISVLIHLIYFDLEEFQKLPVIHTNTYIKFNQLLEGKELRELKSINISLENVINDFEGLNHCIEMLKTNKLKYFMWELLNSKFIVKLKERFIEEDELIHCVKYALFKPIINLLNIRRVETNDVEKTIDIIFRNKKFYALPHKEVLIEFKELSNKDASLKQIKELKDKVVVFLELFKNFINQFDIIDVMYEVEVAAKVPKLDVIKKNLLNSKHIFIKKEKQVTIFLIKDNGDFVIRLRISPGSSTLSFKGGIFDEAREEIESEIKDYEAVYNMFLRLGFKLDTFFFRTREYFTNKDQNITITLDDTIGSPDIVEIEKVIEKKNQKEKVEKELKKYFSKFLQIEAFITKDEFYEMLNEYKKKNKKKTVDFDEIRAFINY